MFFAVAAPATAEKIRLATFNVELGRDGPGLLLRDILRGEDPQVLAAIEVITRMSPDILVLQKFDYDLNLLALGALRDALAVNGPDYPHIFALRPNSGMATGLDMDGDGRRGEARDGQGYGAFSGHQGMAILSRYPVAREDLRDFSTILWRDLPQANLPVQDGMPFPSSEALSIQRLSSVGHWLVPVDIGETRLALLVFHATPPVFDGPEDRNGWRNHDELIFWRHFLDGDFGPPPTRSFALVGTANLDPNDSDGRREAIRTLIDDPRLQDPRPMRSGLADQEPGQTGDPRLDTVHWPPPGPGALRVDYILPSADLDVTSTGVFWPPDGSDDATIVRRASRHRLVWVDLLVDDP